MWILERANARDGAAIVRYPDTDTTGVAPRWTITLHPEVAVWCDPSVATVEQLDGTDQVTLDRGAGDQLVVIGRAGEIVVTDPSATWTRTLSPHDVLVLEGDDPGTYVITPQASGAAWTVTHVRSATTSPLRWIP